MMPLCIDTVLRVAATAGLVWSTVEDVHSHHIPRLAGWGILAAGVLSLGLSQLWLACVFYLAAVWASGGGFRRIPVMIFALPLFVQGSESFSLVIGILFVLALFEMGWFGGGDAQLAFGLIALAQDWWMIVYLLGGTILLAVILVVRRSGLMGALKRFQWVFSNLDAPDKQAIRIPWAVIAAIGGAVHFWIYPGAVWR